MLIAITYARAWYSAWLLLLNVGHALADLNNNTSPTHAFKSRPDIHAPIIEMTILRPELLTPGYIFLAPYRNVAPGPYIYDNFGELVWSGAGSAGPKTAHNPHVCQYKGRDHLCYFQGDQHHGFARGFGVIMDNTYRIVKTVESAGSGASSDMHEFRLTPYSDGKSAIVTVYQTRHYDLTVNPRFNMRNGMGWIIDSVFQEIDVESGRLLFEWRSLDHVDPQVSWVMPGTTDTSGNGLDSFNAWDYFHINSVDKNRAGDYLISARHASAIYKISGRDGRILWQIGGVAPTIECVGFKFGFQHEARWLDENATHTVMSVFDNAGNSYNHTSEWSRGAVISIEHATNKASLVKAWYAPDAHGGLKSGSQGSLQLLADGGAHIAWGEHAYISEHTADGSAVMYGRLALRESNVMIYRSYKLPWTAYPRTNPSMWTFSKTGDDVSGTRFFISWNGATEVRSWRLYSAMFAAGPFQLATHTKRRGFETEVHMTSHVPWTYAEALDAAGVVLGQTPKTRTFVPSISLAAYCDDRGCQDNEAVPENDTVPYYAAFETSPEHLSTNQGFDTADYYVDVRVASGSSSSQPSTANRYSSTGFIMVVCVVMLTAVLWSSRRGLLGESCRTITELIIMLPRLAVSFCLDRAKSRRRVHEKDEWELMSTTSTQS